MGHKFTADGKKVAVIGALNAKETIVQEIFVADGTEFPAGEHFVVKTLLDTPAETYKAKEERRILESIKKLEDDRDRLSSEIAGFRLKAKAAAAKIKWIEGVTDSEVSGVFDNLRSMMCGEYTHVVFPQYLEIKEWSHDLFTMRDDYNRNQFEALSLISLFGNWNKRLGLNWKVNTYCDGSGSWKNIIPCKSIEEAVEVAKGIVDAQDYLSDSDYEFCLKHGIAVDEGKNATRISRKTENIEKQIADRKKQVERLEDDLRIIMEKEKP